MKTIRLLLTGLILCYGSGLDVIGQEVVKGGDTFSTLGMYSIIRNNTEENRIGDLDCAYLLKFENSDLLVKVCIWEEQGIKKYVALSDGLSVQYAYNKDFIGIERLSKEFLKYGFYTNDSCLNRYQYFHQRIIARGERSDIENVALIAAYYPHLVIKGQNTFIAN